jgi:hypothetical protein
VFTLGDLVVTQYPALWVPGGADSLGGLRRHAATPRQGIAFGGAPASHGGLPSRRAYWPSLSSPSAGATGSLPAGEIPAEVPFLMRWLLE